MSRILYRDFYTNIETKLNLDIEHAYLINPNINLKIL